MPQLPSYRRGTDPPNRSSAASSAHVDSLAATLALVLVVVTVVALGAVAADSVDVLAGEGVAGLVDVEDAVDEEEEHVEEGEEEEVKLAGGSLQLFHQVNNIRIIQISAIYDRLLAKSITNCH